MGISKGETIVRYQFFENGDCIVDKFPGSEKVGRNWKLGGSYTRIAESSLGSKVVAAGTAHVIYMHEKGSSFEKAKEVVIDHLMKREAEVSEQCDRLRSKIDAVKFCRGPKTR